MKFTKILKFSKVLALLCILGFIAAGAFAPGPAHASLLGNLFAKKQAAPDLGDIYPIQHEDDFQAVAKSYHGTPYNDPQLEFEILVPKDWTYEEPVQMNEANGTNRQLMGDLARFRSPVIGTVQAIVTVQSIKLDREISAENWLQYYIISNSYELDGTVAPICADKVAPCHNEKKAGASYVMTAEGTSSYVYVTVQINGSNAVLVKFESPIGDPRSMPLKEALAFVRKRIVESFRFILETDQPIEVQKPSNLSDAVKFRYPGSLDLKNIYDSDSRHMSLQLFNMERRGRADLTPVNYTPQTLGLIRIIAVKRVAGTNLKKETDDIKNYIEGPLGLEFRKPVDSRKAPVSKRFLFSRYEVYQVVSKKGNAIEQELRFVALGDRNWYIFAFLLSPSDSENFYAWANNTQDFDRIVKDFR